MAAFAALPGIASHGLHGKRSALRVHQEHGSLALRLDGYLKQRSLTSLPQRYPHLHWRPVVAVSSILAIGAVGSVRTISASLGVVRINRAHYAVDAVSPICPIKTVGARAAGKVAANWRS